MSALQMINSREQLLKLKDELGLRNDWHEPDEMDVEARVYGTNFDNAGFWGPNLAPYQPHAELHVVLYHKGRPVAAVNLATLFAWATGLEVNETRPETKPAPPAEMPDGFRVIRTSDGRVMSKVLDLGAAGRMARTMNESAKDRGRDPNLYEVQPFWRPKLDEPFEVVDEIKVTVVGRGLPSTDVDAVLNRALGKTL